VKCKYCDCDNPQNSKFCRNCGKPLDIKIYCNHCGKELKPDSKFCVYCGSKVKKKSNINTGISHPNISKNSTNRRAGISGRKNIPEKPNIWKTAAFVLMAIVFLGSGVLGVQYLSSSSRAPVPASSRNVSTASGLDNFWPAEVQEIATKFNCPCGSCNDRLDVCTCSQSGGAVEAKTYIKTLLQKGLSADDVINKVEQRYGNRI